MTWGDRASDRYSAEVVEKKPSVGRWLGAIMDAVSGSTPDTTAEFEFRIKDKRTGAILSAEPYGGAAAQEALSLAEERLEQMTVAQFRDEYSLEEPAES
jgi:hypothetical protein